MTPESQRQAIRRMKIIAGQVAALEKHIQEDRYCMDVLDLSHSIQKALRSLDALVIDGHLHTHVVEMMKGGEEEKAIAELQRLYRVQGPAES
jgi:DNA-binding FrmR family transcriptional regulator